MGLVSEISAPRDDALLQSAAEGIPVEPSAQRRGVHEAHVQGRRARARPARGGAPRSPEGPPRLRVPSAARFLGRLAGTRNQQLIVRWRQALEARTAVGLSSC